jgi:hypothetical protein
LDGFWREVGEGILGMYGIGDPFIGTFPERRKAFLEKEKGQPP